MTHCKAELQFLLMQSDARKGKKPHRNYDLVLKSQAVVYKHQELISVILMKHAGVSRKSETGDQDSGPTEDLSPFGLATNGETKHPWTPHMQICVGRCIFLYLEDEMNLHCVVILLGIVQWLSFVGKCVLLVLPGSQTPLGLSGRLWLSKAVYHIGNRNIGDMGEQWFNTHCLAILSMSVAPSKCYYWHRWAAIQLHRLGMSLQVSLQSLQMQMQIDLRDCSATLKRLVCEGHFP